MFTGIIEEVGVMRRMNRSGQAMMLTVEAKRIMDDVRLGDSIAVCGVCLTVTSFDDASFTADVVPETYRKTNLHMLKPGDPVNLERAMPANGRFGGHIVQGHVDGTAIVESRRAEENAVVFTFRPERTDLLRYMLPRGSITVDGISLTLISVTDTAFSVSIIPHTLSETALRLKKSGDLINVECDVLGKYIERLLIAGRPAAGNGSIGARQGGLSAAFLSEHGFM